MPNAEGVMTPLKAIWRAGYTIQTEDMAGQRENVCVAANDAQAEWVGYSLAMYHKVPYRVVNENDAVAREELKQQIRDVNSALEDSSAESPG